MYKQGDYILYVPKNELGVVKRVCDDGVFVWYYLGGTANKTPYDTIEPLSEEMVAKMINTFSNSYCFKSLQERRRRLFCGEDTSDFIDVYLNGELVVDKERNK